MRCVHNSRFALHREGLPAATRSGWRPRARRRASVAGRHSLLRSLVTPGQINARPGVVRSIVDVACQ